MPNAVARNGTDRPMNVLVHPSPSTVWKLTTTIASVGTSRVATNTTNSSRLPGNCRIANAYAASTDVTTWATVTMTATTSELTRYRPSRPDVQASRYTSSVNPVGSERVLQHLVARLQRGDDRRVHREHDDHGDDGEQEVPTPSTPADRFVERPGPAGAAVQVDDVVDGRRADGGRRCPP